MNKGRRQRILRKMAAPRTGTTTPAVTPLTQAAPLSVPMGVPPPAAPMPPSLVAAPPRAAGVPRLSAPSATENLHPNGLHGKDYRAYMKDPSEQNRNNMHNRTGPHSLDGKFHGPYGANRPEAAGPPMTWRNTYNESERMYEARQPRPAGPPMSAASPAVQRQVAWDAQRQPLAQAQQSRQIYEAKGAMNRRDAWGAGVAAQADTRQGATATPMDAIKLRYQNAPGGHQRAIEIANGYGAKLDMKLLNTPVPITTNAEAPSTELAHYNSSAHKIVLRPKQGADTIEHELDHAGRMRAEGNGSFYQPVVNKPTWDDSSGHGSVRGEVRAEQLRNVKTWGADYGRLPTVPKEADQLLQDYNKARPGDPTIEGLLKTPGAGVELLKTVKAQRVPLQGLQRPPAMQPWQVATQGRPLGTA